MLYKILAFNKLITREEFENFFRVINKLSPRYSLEIRVIHGKLNIYLCVKKELFFASELILPLKIIQDEEVGLSSSLYRSKGFISLYKSIEKLHRSNSLEHKRVYKIILKPIFRKFVPLKIGIGYICYLNNKKKLFFISDIITFITLEKNSKLRYEKAPIELKPNIEDFKSMAPLLSSNYGSLGIDNFDYLKHTLIIGQSGVGKSKFIELFCSSILTQNVENDYSIIIIDPHKNIFHDTENTVIPDFDFKEKSLGLFSNIGDPLTSTELSVDLLSTLLGNTDNHYLYRVLKYSLLLLYSTKRMSLHNLHNLLTDLLYRKEVLKETTYISLKDFFESEYVEISAKHYQDAVLPILNLISEFSLMSSTHRNESDFNQAIKENRIITISANIATLGTKITKLIDGALIQQLFTLVQSGSIRKDKLILIVDEVSVIENPSLVKILSEARKFGLHVILSFQYLDQISIELQHAIRSNIINYFCFKVSREDALRILSSINIEFDERTIRGKKFEELKDKEIKLLTSLNPREVVARIMKDDKYFLPIKLKTISI